MSLCQKKIMSKKRYVYYNKKSLIRLKKKTNQTKDLPHHLCYTKLEKGF